MPELPEVEMIKRVIEPHIKGLAIENIIVNHPEVIAHPQADEFIKHLTGQKFSAMERRGKFLIIKLKSKNKIILHLRLTGCLSVTPKDYPLENHTHVVFGLSNNKELRFSDTRRFGRFWLIKNGEDDTYSSIAKLGIEPFDKCLTAEYLQVKFGKRKKAIKECLLDQSVVAGLGNIYSDEILFAAKLNPNRAANSLNVGEWERLAVTIPELLTFFIEKNTIAPEEYLETKGRDYRNTPFLKAYGKEGKPCPICGSALQKSMIGGRSSVFCTKCQGEL